MSRRADPVPANEEEEEVLRAVTKKASGRKSRRLDRWLK